MGRSGSSDDKEYFLVLYFVILYWVALISKNYHLLHLVATSLLYVKTVTNLLKKILRNWAAFFIPIVCILCNEPYVLVATYVRPKE